MWHPRWHEFDAKPLGWLEEIGTKSSLAQTLNMGWIAVIHWITNIYTVGSCPKVNSLHALSPKEHCDLKWASSLYM